MANSFKGLFWTMFLLAAVLFASLLYVLVADATRGRGGQNHYDFAAVDRDGRLSFAVSKLRQKNCIKMIHQEGAF